ncbi:hypothetical protein BK142_24305 [Paenibacillus glucanolyticus]|nr:hypothetical protein BK142_24305 [Paenibacillus glucanolyticus]
MIWTFQHDRIAQTNKEFHLQVYLALYPLSICKPFQHHASSGMVTEVKYKYSDYQTNYTSDPNVDNKAE